MIRKIILITLMTVFIASCATNKKSAPQSTSPRMMSELAQGKRLFESGYYKRAMQQLLPLAAEGNAEAQYAVGYMYYYGFGINRDTSSGTFWIKRSAAQQFKPAIKALAIMKNQKSKTRKKLR